MKTYEAVFSEDNTDGVFGISLVHDPAMEGTFVALNKQEPIKFAEVDLEQRILMGLVLEPNKPVYRNQNGEEFNIVFSEQTIKDLSYNFFKSNFHKNSTIEHEESNKIEGVTFFESWIVEDSKKDKSNLYGFSYPKGSWIATMKVDNDDIWNNYVKTGKVKGFSIDAMLSLKEVNLKSEVNMSSEIKSGFEKLTDTLMTALNLKKEAEPKEEKTEEIKLGMIKSADGSLTLEFEGEELVAGAAIFAVAETGEKVPVPAGDYELENGQILSVQEDGVVASIGSIAKEEAPAEMEAEAPAPAPSGDASQIMDALEQSIKSVMIKYSEEMNAKIEALTKSNEELKAQVLEFSEQPAAKKIKSQPTSVELNSKGRILSKLRK